MKRDPVMRSVSRVSLTAEDAEALLAESTLAQRARWRYLPKTRTMRVPDAFAAKLEAAGLAKIQPPDEAA